MRLAAALVAALALAAPAASAHRADTPGVTSSTILLGGTGPLSGPETAYAPVLTGAQAYFDYVNDHGGVFGRKITFKVVDDGYDPARTVQATRQLVEQDQVLAMFNSIGTEQNLAVRSYLNQLHVPQLFVGSGTVTIAAEHKQFPWTIGMLPSFAGEGAVYGRQIVATRPKARIAVLYEDSDYGKDLLSGLRRGLGSHAGQIVATQSYEVTDVDVSSQVQSLKASGADTFVIFALPKQAIQAFVSAAKLAWRPQTYVSSVSIDPIVMKIVRLSAGPTVGEGATSTAFLHDPTNPTQRKAKGVLLYRAVMKRYLPNEDPGAVAHLYGMMTAYAMVDALKHAGRNPTRDSLMRAATHMNERNPFLLDDVALRTTPSDIYPLRTTHLVRFRRGVWTLFGKLQHTS